MNRKKATCEDIKKIVKVLKEHKLKPNKEGFIALRYPIHSVNVTPAMIRKAIKILKKHIKREKPYYVEVENPVESGDPLDSITVGDDLTVPLSGTPFYRDSVGTEELDEDTG